VWLVGDEGSKRAATTLTPVRSSEMEVLGTLVSALFRFRRCDPARFGTARGAIAEIVRPGSHLEALADRWARKWVRHERLLLLRPEIWFRRLLPKRGLGTHDLQQASV